jgi:bifunctional non-homologous end joining protein LigD
MLTKEFSKLPVIRLSFIEPMYTQAVSELPNGDLWTYEAKLDGYRCLAAKQDGRVVLWSRRGNGFTARFHDIADACANLPPDTLIDGEVVAIDETGRVSFNALQHTRPHTHIQFYAFDIDLSGS